MQKNSHCSYCGALFGLEQRKSTLPQRCGNCGNVTYFNPLPVAVVLVPVDDGLLLVRRAIPPQIGRLALPGGFINMGETWQQAGAREVSEETGLTIDPDELRLYATLSAEEGMLLVFGLAQQRGRNDLPDLLSDFIPNSETSEIVVASSPVELAFPLHNQVAQRFWLDNHARLQGWMAS